MDSQSLPHIPSSRGDASNASLQEKIACTIREARQGEPPKDVFIKDVWPILEVDYKTMVRELVEFCKNKLREKRITCNVTGRAKSRDSISESLHRREKHLMEQQNKQYESLRDILNDIHDLAGIRIVVDFPSDIDNVSSFIQETFRQVKEPNVFSPDRRVSDVWQPLFGAYKTCNYRVEVKLGTEGALSQYCGVMFEIQLTDLSESLYNRFAHPFLYKKSSDQLDRQDEIVVDMSHGIALLYSLCLVYMQDRLESSASYIDEKDKLLGAMRQAEAEGNLDALLQTMPEVPGSDVENHTVASADRSLKRRPSFRGTVPIRVLTKALETSEEGCNSADALWALLINKFRGPECEDDRHVADADAWIRDKHYNTGRLKIERLSGDLLSMDQCYINLAIVEQPGGMAGRSDTAQPSPFSLLARQKVETPEKTIQVELATIFNQRKGCDGRMIQPRRILIRGRAGVGKTTLCKKMVYDFTCDPQTRLHRSWTELFDRLLWVPLRHLKGRSAAGYNYEDLFHHEYFSRQGHDHGRRLAKALWRTVDTHSDRTLFILDGLDEIYDDLAREDDMSRFLTDLLNQRNVIITSRPNASFPALRDLDLELETIGFYPDQVQAYLEADPKIKPRANEVQSFLRDHWLLQGLVRIPIQLDALCYTWDDFDPGTAPDTMTHIYQAIERRLWKKDAVRLDKMCKGHARSARPTEIERRVKTEIALLESLAFNGLHSDVIDFTPAHRDEIVDMFPLSDLPLDEALARVSFLRTSDSSSKVKDRNYHFIHLTFQEYFAARYFIQQWTSGEQLSVLKLSSRQERSRVTKINAEEFLRKEKYNARYGIFWRFVAGLLHANSDEGQLCRFFRTIEEQPRDLLGPVHQRLVMHCLSEVVPSQEIPEFITGLQEQLNQWLVFEYTLLGRSNLARELEFPDQILEAVLRDKSEDGFSGGLKRAVLDVFRYHRKTLPEPALDALVALLKDTDSKMRRIVAEALGRQSALSEPALEALVAILKDADSGVRRAAAEALSWQSALSEPALNALVALLKDADWRPQYAAAKVLGSQSALSEPVLDALVALLKDTDLGVRRAAAEALGRQSALSESALSESALKALLKDADSGLRRAAAEALGRQSALSERTLSVLVALLKDADWDMWDAAVEVFGSQSALSEPALEALVALLKAADLDVRRIAAEVLGQQSALSEPALEALVDLLKDANSDVRLEAAVALGGQSALSEPALEALVALLKDADSDVRRAAAEVFGSQSALSEPALEALVALLKDADSDVRHAAAEVLGSQSAVSEPALSVLVALLNDAASDVRRVAAEVLAPQSALSERALEALVAILKDANSDVRRAAAEALSWQSALSEPALNALMALLKDTESKMRRIVAEALGQQSALSEPALEALVALLKDADSDVRCAAAEALSWQSALSEPALNALMALLKDADWGPRHVAAEALGSQSALPALSDERFCSFLLIMDSQSFNNLYSVWLKRSFSDHLIWYIEGKKCRLNVPEGGRDVPFNQLIHQLKSAVQKAQVSLKVPEDSILKDV